MSDLADPAAHKTSGAHKIHHDRQVVLVCKFVFGSGPGPQGATGQLGLRRLCRVVHTTAGRE